MKFRTDFVTNSSSSSFLIFSVNNPELYDFLSSLNIQILDTEKNHFSDSMQILLPSGEKLELFMEDADWYPTYADCTSISSWLLTIILNEVESVYPPKELDEYSDFTIALLNLLKEKGILNIDMDDTSSWDRELLEDEFSKFDKMDNSIKEANIEFNTGFEGEICHMEYVITKNGYCLSIHMGCDFDDMAEDNNLERLNVMLIGEESEFHNKEHLIEFIKEHHGNCKTEITPDIDYVVCNNLDKKDKRLQQAEEFCIPVISEKGFLNHFGEKIVFNEDDLCDDLFECTYEGGFYDMFYEYGIGTVTRTTPKDIAPRQENQ